MGYVFQPTAGYSDDEMFIGHWLDGTCVRAWTPLEEANASLPAEQESFMTQLNDAIGPATDPEGFLYGDLTPEFEYYADGVEDGFKGAPDEMLSVPIPTPGLGDTYIGVSLTLTRGSAMVQDRVVKRARDNNGNVIGPLNENPIF